MVAILLTVWLLHVAALVTPGANVLLVSQLSLSQGRDRGSLAALGVTLGAGMWATFAVLGVNSVFEAFPRVRTALQLAGGCYLLFVATRLWRSKGSGPTDASRPVSALAAFRLGLLTNVTNPKSALFFGSVFATSLPASAGPLLQALAVAIVVVNALAWHLFLAHAFSRPRIRSAYAAHGRSINRAAGALLAALGLRVLVGALSSERP